MGTRLVGLKLKVKIRRGPPKLCCKEEAGALWSSMLQTDSLNHMWSFYGPSARRRSEQRDIWDCLSSGKTLARPEA